MASRLESDDRPREDMVESPELATETMARLYEAQGFFDRAKQARKGLFAQGLWKLVEMGQEALREEGLSVEPSPGGLACRWRLSEHTISALRGRVPQELLETKGADIALRLAAVEGQHRMFWDLHPLRPGGSCLIQPVAPLDAVIVALGLRTGTGRFLPAYHAEPQWLRDF